MGFTGTALVSSPVSEHGDAEVPDHGEVTVRDASTEDAGAVVEAHVSAIEAAGPDAYDDRQVDAWAERPGGAEPYRENARAGDEVFVVAERPIPGAPEGGAAAADRGVVGFGHLRPPAVRDDPDPGEGEVTAVYVHGDHQGTGVGRALLDHLEARARERGLDALVLWSSLNAVEFYEGHGYERVREAVHETTGGVELDVVVMRKRLRE